MKHLAEGDQIKDDEGIVVIELNLSSNGDEDFDLLARYVFNSKTKIPIDAPPAFEQKNKNDLLVVSLPADSYKWRWMNCLGYYRSFDEESGFKVLPGQITYLGTVNTYLDTKEGGNRVRGSIQIVDNTDGVILRLKDIYPSLVAKYPFNVQLTELVFGP